MIKYICERKTKTRTEGGSSIIIAFFSNSKKKSMNRSYLKWGAYKLFLNNCLKIGLIQYV
jgi:hypothetical protein